MIDLYFLTEYYALDIVHYTISYSIYCINLIIYHIVIVYIYNKYN